MEMNEKAIESIVKQVLTNLNGGSDCSCGGNCTCGKTRLNLHNRTK